MTVILNQAAAAAFHQQANALLPAGHRAETFGSSPDRLFAVVHDPANQEVAQCSGSASQVLAELETLSFPATDAFLRH